MLKSILLPSVLALTLQGIICAALDLRNRKTGSHSQGVIIEPYGAYVRRYEAAGKN
jgi:hypothetical protein